MPDTWTYVPVTYVIESFNDLGKVTSTSRVNTQVARVYRSVPAGSYRKRPADYFMEGTSRTTVREYYETTSTTWWTAGKYSRYSNYPVSLFYDNLENAQTPSTPTIDTNAVRNTIRNQLRGQAVNLAMCLAEYHQTAQLFADVARIVTTKGKGLARGFAGVKKSSHTIAKQHLAFQYGVRPLINDLIDGYKSLTTASYQKPLIIHGKVRRTAHAEKVSKLAPNTSVVYGPDSLANIEANKMVVFDTHWRAYMDPSSLQNTLARYGFTNPISLAYELTPYSFVLDWFINVGDVLASLDNLTLCKELWVRESSRTMTSIRCNAANKTLTGSCTYSRIVDARGAPLSIPRVNTLQYKPSVSLTHVLNGLALLRTARRGVS